MNLFLIFVYNNSPFSPRLQVPLSALSPPRSQPGPVGGCFNSTTRMKCIPLPPLYNQLQVTQRGVRSVSVHSDRYLPSARHRRTASDSQLQLPSLENRQRVHLMQQETSFRRARQFKASNNRTHPHRTDKPFYMSGNGVQIFQRSDPWQEQLEKMKDSAETPSLCYEETPLPVSRDSSMELCWPLKQSSREPLIKGE